MVIMFLLLFSLHTLGVSSPVSHKRGTESIQLRMPGVVIPHNDTYYHMSTELQAPLYVRGYRAQASSDVVHHLLLYGCRSIKTREHSAWIGGPPCLEGTKILWSWALDAPQFMMPENVSMVIGGQDIRYLVMELHFKVKQPESYKDTSGVDIFITNIPTPYSAGIFLFLAENGTFPPAKKHLTLDLSCNYTTPPINVFAYRTHAHTFATLISGYKEARSNQGNQGNHGNQGNSSWTQIGSRDPRLPEMFLRTETVIVIEPGDILHARCEYNTKGTNKTVIIGNTHHDEMCNMYLMYYTDAAHIDKIASHCANQQTFIVPDDKVTWYDRYLKNRTLLLLFICISTILIGVPTAYGIKYCCCQRKFYYKRPNDGFQKLFTPLDEDEDEDEILYRSFKNSY